MSSEEGIVLALENLHEIEDNARKLYEELFEKLEDREMKDFFSWLIEAEERHRDMIEEALELMGKEKDI